MSISSLALGMGVAVAQDESTTDTQPLAPGKAPGQCIQQDRMRELIEQLETADGYILASPTNFYSVTAVFKRFMERLIVYAYWPWGAHAPKLRKKKRHGSKMPHFG